MNDITEGQAKDSETAGTRRRGLRSLLSKFWAKSQDRSENADGDRGFQFFSGSIERPLLIVIAALGLTTILCNLDFNLLEASLYDLRMSHGSQTSPDPDIVLITLDDTTTKELDSLAPLSLDYHAKFMEALERLDPRGVGYLVDFNHVEQSDTGLADKQAWGKRFVDAANRMQAKGTAVLLGTPFDVTGEVLPPYPMSTLPHSIAVIHKDGNVFSEDKVTRRALTYLNDRAVFHTELATRLGAIPAGRLPRGSFYVPEVDGKYFFFRYHGSTELDPKQPGKLPYSRVSFISVLKGELPAESLKGKVVLVGTLSKEDSGDFAFTPYSKTSFVNPRLIVHANILDSLMHNQGIIRAPQWVNWLQTFAVTLFVIWWVLNSTPLYGVFATLSLAILMAIAGQVLFQLRGLWMRESATLVGIFVAYYLVVPYRLIREYKKRWDFQRKNELLTQVEELKTNFLSLVTHDLKTPVARIQGLAEVLLRKSSPRLIDRDKETIHHIIQSTEELNHFISSILELSKVESNRLHLNLASKDVNQIIERLAVGFKAQATSKKIKLISELEPLFPIRIDSNLIGKVISNLVDNAIKYSPPDSEVRIGSREVGEFVEISVADQGIGMTQEELENLFTKFYRAKNDTTTEVTGTGLGLYLTKYFIEAHQGRVEVASEKDRGSVFKIYLPLKMQAAGPDEQASRPGLLIRRGLGRVESILIRTRRGESRAAETSDSTNASESAVEGGLSPPTQHKE